jgi:hypothetical protein
MPKLLAPLFVLATLTLASAGAAASTRIACDWSGTIASEPQALRLYLTNGGETRDMTRFNFKLAVRRSAKSIDRRSDTSCPEPDGAADVELTDIRFNYKRGDTIRVRRLYMDDSMSPGRSWFELIDCKKDRSTVC